MRDPTAPLPSDATYPGVPRWVKGTLFVTLGLIVLGIVIALVVGGHQGPTRHMGS